MNFKIHRISKCKNVNELWQKLSDQHKDEIKNYVCLKEKELIQISLTIGFKQKIKMKTRNIMATSYRLRVSFFSCLAHGVTHPRAWVKSKFFR